MPKCVREDIPKGAKYGSLTILDNIYKNGIGYLLVKCDCGNIETKKKYPIKSGKVIDCLKCSDKRRSAHRLTGYKDISGTVIGKIRRNAEARGIKFEVDAEYLYLLFQDQKGRCALSGIPISIEKKDKHHKCTASLDRIRSDEDYTTDNVQWVHQDVNYMKQDFEEKYFIELCRSIANNNK